MIVPSLRVGMQPSTLRVDNRTRSAHSGVTTRSVGTIIREQAPSHALYFS
jgi:hypothetical protein